jgi:DNA-binding transcriptional MerR regulator
MFKIGEFSKICQVSIRMLRHYDEIGIFQPVHVDRETGYRYYSADQLPRLNRILALKDLGLTTVEIAKLVDDTIEAAEIRGMLRLKQAQLQQKVREEQYRLMRVQSRLQQIEEEGHQPPYDVVIKHIEAQDVVSIRETAPTMSEMGHLLIETHRVVHRSGLKNLLPGLAIFHDPHYEEQKVDWEIAFPIDASYQAVLALEDGRPLVRRTLPAVDRMACIVYPGSFVGLHIGYSALGSWIQANQYVINGKGREVFLHLDATDKQAHVTEIQFPVRRVDSPLGDTTS